MFRAWRVLHPLLIIVTHLIWWFYKCTLHISPLPIIIVTALILCIDKIIAADYPVTDRIIIIVYVANDGSAVTKDPDLEKINVYGGAQFLIITHVSLLAK